MSEAHDWEHCPNRAIIEERAKRQEDRDAYFREKLEAHGESIAGIDRFLHNGFQDKILAAVKQTNTAATARSWKKVLKFLGTLAGGVALAFLLKYLHLA